MTDETRSPNRYKSERAPSVMENLYLNIDRKEQARIVADLQHKTGLSTRRLATAVGWNRSSLILYLRGKSRIPYARFLDLCHLANVDEHKHALNFVVLERRKGEKLDLSTVDESQLQTLEPYEWQKVVAAGIMTDGSLYCRKLDNKYRMYFSSTDKNLHAFFQKMVLIAFSENASAFVKDKRKNLWGSYYCLSPNNQMVRKLLAFSETYCTTKGKKPTLDFIMNERIAVKIQALRFAMSCDGSVSIKKTKGNPKSYSLRLACAHPDLNLQWKQLFSDIGIELNVDKDHTTWSGIHGLATSKKESFQRFFEIGGFLPTNVKCTNGNYVGKEKNEVLRMIMNYRHLATPNTF